MVLQNLTAVYLTEEEGREILNDFYSSWFDEYAPMYVMEDHEPGEMEQKFIDAFPDVATELKRQRLYERIWHDEIEMDESILALHRASWTITDSEERSNFGQELRGHQLNLMLERYPEMTDLVEASWLAIFLPIAEKLRLDKQEETC